MVNVANLTTFLAKPGTFPTSLSKTTSVKYPNFSWAIGDFSVILEADVNARIAPRQFLFQLMLPLALSSRR